MQILDFNEYCDGGKSVNAALGFFDGVHIAHRKIISSLMERSRPTAVVTFRTHPKKLLWNKAQGLIDSFEERMAKIASLGVDYALILDDVENVMDLCAKDFLLLLKKRLSPTRLSCGYNYSFGKNAQGDCEILREFCKEEKIDCFICPKVSVLDVDVSSNAIRTMISSGDVKTARTLLLSCYSVCGEVVRGVGRGRKMGLPTANIAFPDEKIRPALGVYATRTTYKGKSYPSLSNIGSNPTFGGKNITFETHILSFDGNLYGETLEVEFLERVRPEIKFSNAGELEAQIKKDIEYIRTL